MTAAPVTIDRALAEFALTQPKPCSADDHISFAMLPVGQIHVDPAYQRQISTRGRQIIRRIIEGFTWSRFGALTVAARDETSWSVIDGQHRHIAALLLGVPHVPAIIVSDAEVAAEARSFVGINTVRSAVTPADKFRARVTAGDPDAVELAQMLTDLKIDYDPPPGPLTKPRQTRALSMLQKLHAKPGAGTLYTALEMLADVEDDLEALSAIAIRAVTMLTDRVLTQGGDIDRLARGVAESDFDEIKARATTLAKIKRAQNWACAQELLTDAYNKGLQRKLGEGAE